MPIGHANELTAEIQELQRHYNDIRRRLAPSHPYDPNRPLDGIIRVISRSQVSVISSDVWSDDPKLQAVNILDFASNNCFYSKSEPDMFVGYVFTGLRIFVTHYTLRSNCNLNTHQIKSWAIEVSDGDGNWLEVDQRETEAMCNIGAVSGFSIPHPAECSAIRIRQTGLNSSSYQCLTLSAFELFGDITRTQ
jgi:hypothetical protein